MTVLEKMLWTLALVLFCGFLFLAVSAMFYRFLDTPYLILYASTCAAATAMAGATAVMVTDNRING